MYTQQEINKALKLYDRLHSTRKTVLVLGYPSRTQLKKWINERRETGRVVPKKSGKRSRINENEQRRAAEIYLQNERKLIPTLKELGYSVTSKTLQIWLKKYFPNQQVSSTCKQETTIGYSQEIKRKAVLAMRQKKRTVISVAREFGISRQTLYSWEKELTIPLGPEGEMLMSLHRRQSKKNIVSTEDVSVGDKLDRALVKVEELERQVSFLVNESEELQEQIYKLRLQKDVLVKAVEILKKDGGVNLESMSNQDKVLVIDALREQYKLKDLLLIFQLSKSSYFYQHSCLSKPDKYEDLRRELRERFIANHQRYGYRRMWYLLRRAGKVVSEKVIRRLMRLEGLQVISGRKRKYSSYCGEVSPEVPNVLNRDFSATRPNEKWLTDITEFSIPSGKVYLSPIIDCFDGMPVAWTIGLNPTATLANTMLEKAVEKLKPNEYPIIHSDRGGHYRWPEWIKITEKAGLQRSMSKKGCSPDNSACEGFFGRMKNEMFYGRSWWGVSTTDLITQIDDYMRWYGEERIKVSLGGLSPAEFRRANHIT